uniref:Gfo/Idh/MocA family oxidoreductase n=1 Tax=Eiseniibacteriota bacterium TaxID=2212470 RepID=A0A832I4B8_UNCEI
MTEPASHGALAVGLAGAGPWAAKAYAPMLAAGPETRLAAVWARRTEAARALAGAHGAEAVATFDALLERCAAVAFAVPPDVQAALATRAARAGRHLMLDKPLALSLEAARAVAREVEAAGVVTQLMLTHRYRSRTAAFLEAARGFAAIGARLAFLSGAFLRGPYATPWRLEHGALHDLGPHALDLLDAALGPVVEVTGRGDSRGWVSLVLTHAGGAVSEAALSGVMRLPHTVFRVELYGPAGALEFDAVAASAEDPWPTVRRTFVEAVRAGRPPALDVRRGVALQELIERARAALG